MNASAPFAGRESFVGAEPELVEAARVRGFAESVLRCLKSRVTSLFKYLQCHGVTRWCDITAALTLAWVWAEIEHRDGSRTDPAYKTVLNRQQMAHMGFTVAAELGAPIDPRCAAGPKIDWVASDPAATLLTDHELQKVCDASASKLSTSRRELLVAFSLASGDAEEVGSVRRRDVNLRDRTVTFRGSNARVCALDDWSVQAIRRYLKANSAAREERLCVKPDTPPQRAALSVTNRLCAILKDAGFGGRCGVMPRSIRLTAAHRVLKDHGIVAATKFLGSPSLDNTAAALGHSWQRPVASGVEGTGR